MNDAYQSKRPPEFRRTEPFADERSAFGAVALTLGWIVHMLYLLCMGLLVAAGILGWALVWATFAAPELDAAAAPRPEVWQGTVLDNHDADTLNVLHAGQKDTVRLEHIDSEEFGQGPYGIAGKYYLAGRTAGRKVRIEINGRERYGRAIGVVWIGQDNLNLEVVRLGLAWHYKAYSRPADVAKVYAEAEAEARAHRVGLWSQKNPKPPWEWRQEQKQAQQKKKAA